MGGVAVACINPIDRYVRVQCVAHPNPNENFRRRWPVSMELFVGCEIHDNLILNVIMSDGSKKQGVYEKFARSWLRTDPATAGNWLVTAPISAELRDRILKSPSKK